MTSPNTIIADMQLVETNLRQQIAHLNDEIAGLKSDVEIIIKHRASLVRAMKKIYNLRPFGSEATEYAINVENIAREALGSVKGGS